MYKYQSTNKRNPAIYTTLFSICFFITILIMNFGFWYCFLLVGLYPLIRYSKPIAEWVEIDNSEIRFSKSFLNTEKTRILASELKLVERICERTVTQGKYGPIINDDWTINFIENSGLRNRTSDIYPSEFNYEILQFCKRNNIASSGIEDTCKLDEDN